MHAKTIFLFWLSCSNHLSIVGLSLNLLAWNFSKENRLGRSTLHVFILRFNHAVENLSFWDTVLKDSLFFRIAEWLIRCLTKYSKSWTKVFWFNWSFRLKVIWQHFELAFHKAVITISQERIYKQSLIRLKFFWGICFGCVIFKYKTFFS